MKCFRFPPQTVHLVSDERIHDRAEDGDFLQAARQWASGPESAVLLSGGPLDAGLENRYSMALWDPLFTFQCKAGICRIRFRQHTFSLIGDPLSVLDDIALSLTPDFPLAALPFSGGAVGYFAYDLKNSIERLPATVEDDLNLPDAYLIWPRRILIHDRRLRQLRLLTLGLSGEGERQPQPSNGSTPPLFAERHDARPSIQVGELQSNFSREAYLEAVRRVRRYIRAGDVYQVNLSQRYRFSFAGDPFFLWSSLFQLNPAPFYAYIHAGNHQVLSTSMERFLYRSGNTLETRPIKGTRKRGQTPEEDEALRRDLRQSPKDDAELSMIVDLLRNDLGRVCAPRSIRVTDHKRLETYQNVHHLVSIVTGELEPGTTDGEILRATFPGGSITGCPKIRAMEIIDELEPHVRHVYTGSIGYLGWHGNLDLNVAIRTAIVHGGMCTFSVGGGIVHDSREEDEYEETLHKGRTLFEVVSRLREEAVWPIIPLARTRP